MQLVVLDKGALVLGAFGVSGRLVAVEDGTRVGALEPLALGLLSSPAKAARDERVGNRRRGVRLQDGARRQQRQRLDQ